jgi:hypothetical protein
MVSSKTQHIAAAEEEEEDIAVLHKPCGYVLNSGTVPTIILSGCSKKVMARTDAIEENGRENILRSDGTTSVSYEPDKKKVRLDVTQKSQNDVNGYVTSDVQATQLPSSKLSIDFGNDATNKESNNSLFHKKIDDPINSSLETSGAEILHNLKMYRNTNITVKGLPGVTNSQGSNKLLKFGTNINNEKDRKSVYDIIVEHNIAAQMRLPEPKQKIMTKGISSNENRTAPMVYFPESNTPRNTNTTETAAKISERLVHQAYEDWVRCSIPDENGNM